MLWRSFKPNFRNFKIVIRSKNIVKNQKRVTLTNKGLPLISMNESTPNSWCLPPGKLRENWKTQGIQSSLETQGNLREFYYFHWKNEKDPGISKWF